MLSALLRVFFLRCSRSKIIESIVKKTPLARNISRRFIAGETKEDAISVVQRIFQDGRRATLDYLGEEALTKQEAFSAVCEYIKLLDVVGQRLLYTSVSIKLTSIGLAISERLCNDYVDLIAKKACALKIPLEVDMEGSKYKDQTIAVFCRLKDKFPTLKARIAIQGYLRSTPSDIRELAQRCANIRLVKGAYDESNEVAIRDKKNIQEQCIEIMEKLLPGSPYILSYSYLALGSHDPVLIKWLIDAIKKRDMPKYSCEFQMLYGVREDEQIRLTRDGWNVRVYVPYGNKWFPYFMRRMAERPANVCFVIRAIINSLTKTNSPV